VTAKPQLAKGNSVAKTYEYQPDVQEFRIKAGYINAFWEEYSSYAIGETDKTFEMARSSWKVAKG